jgi:uncharacterized C2H2 Zn-finger protein
VKTPPTLCPRCEALHPFRPQWRHIGEGKIEVFLRCPHCNYKVVLRESTEEIERLRKLELAWESRARAALAKHGVPNSLSQAQLRRIRRLRSDLEAEINDGDSKNE